MTIGFAQPAPLPAAQLLTQGEAIVAETFDRALASGSNIFTSQAIRCALLPLRAGQRVTSLSCYVNPGQAGITDAWMLLYSPASVLLAQSASTPAAFAANGIVTLPMTTPFDASASAAYFAAMLLVTAGTMPTVWGSNPGGSNIGNAFGSGLIRGGVQTGQATPPATAVFATGSANWLPWIAAT